MIFLNSSYTSTFCPRQRGSLDWITHKIFIFKSELSVPFFLLNLGMWTYDSSHGLKSSCIKQKFGPTCCQMVSVSMSMTYQQGATRLKPTSLLCWSLALCFLSCWQENWNEAVFHMCCASQTLLACGNMSLISEANNKGWNKQRKGSR